MKINLPDHLNAGTFAVGCRINHAPEIITLDFIVDTGPGEYVVVERIRLAPSALEPFYLELGDVLGQRR